MANGLEQLGFYHVACAVTDGRNNDVMKKHVVLRSHIDGNRSIQDTWQTRV